MLHSLRMLSLNVVEAIIRWKEQMLHSLLLADSKTLYKKLRSLPFVIRGRNYLLKMKSDQEILRKSVFSLIFNFSSKPDPLLVVPSIDKNDGKQLVVIEAGLAKRIKKATTAVLSEQETVIEKDSSAESLMNPHNIVVYSGKSEFKR